MNDHFPPKGWSVANGYIAEAPTVFGYMQRRCQLIGRCQTQECRRTVFFEYPRLIKQGLADVAATKVMKSLRCNSLDGCSLQFIEKPERVITLREIAGRANIAAQLRCTHCRETKITTVEALIRQLTAHGKGDGETSIKEVGKLITGPCSQCKAVRWDVAFLWHDPKREPFPLWRQQIDQRLADAQRRRDLDRGLVT